MEMRHHAQTTFTLIEHCEFYLSRATYLFIDVDVIISILFLMLIKIKFVFKVYSKSL